MARRAFCKASAPSSPSPPEGPRAGSEIDFATGYIRHMLAFIGITEVQFVTADRLMLDAEASLASAAAQVAALDLAA